MTSASLLKGGEILGESSVNTPLHLSGTVTELGNLSQAGGRDPACSVWQIRGGWVSATICWGSVEPRAANLIAAKPCYCIPDQNVI